MSAVPGLAFADLVSPTWEAYARLAAGRGSAPGAVSRHRLGAHRLFTATNDAGALIGVLLVRANRVGEPDSLHVVVAPAARRRGVASALYARAARDGIDVEGLSGRGGLTPDGEAFRAGRRAA